MSLCLVQRRESPYWVVRGTSDRRAAEEILIKREAEILDQTIHGPLQKHSRAQR